MITLAQEPHLPPPPPPDRLMGKYSTQHELGVKQRDMKQMRVFFDSGVFSVSRWRLVVAVGGI